MNEPLYDTIGKTYNTNRSADPRIVVTLLKLLDLPEGATIADIGAGTGNYSNALADLGYRITAIEPSNVMRKQAKPHKNVRWLEGYAEAIPLPDSSVAGVIIVLALHHFSSIQKASVELHRICPDGPVAILTYDPRKSNEFWFNKYFPEIYKRELDYFPAAAEVAGVLAGDNWKTEFTDFPLPCDLIDKNMHSGWNHPEIYFNEQMLNSSGFAKAPKSEVEQGLSRLREDLSSGTWDKRYGYLRKLKELNTGFLFVKLYKK